MKQWVNILLWSLTGVLVFGLIAFVQIKKNQLEYNDLRVVIDYKDHNFFVEEQGIRDIVKNLGYGYGQPLSSVDLNQIEEILQHNSSILNAEVYATIEGELIIEVVQRRPIMRVFNSKGSSFYIDEAGQLMPTSNTYTSRVLVANGAIDNNITSYAIIRNEEGFEGDSLSGLNTIEQLFELATYIDQDEFWKAQIVQVFVDEENGLELIPRVGNHKIIFGGTDLLEEKFNKLKVFYEKGLSKTGWNEYSVINLKFNDQIVCTKRFI